VLKLKSSSTEGDDSQVLQSMLDDTNSRKNELETELRLVIIMSIMHFKFSSNRKHVEQNKINKKKLV
jgi:hypothetical protein